MIDEEIRELERQLKTDPSAAAKLDAVLARAGRTPRRVWYVFGQGGGEYSDRWEWTHEPFHLTKEGALAHMHEIAKKQHESKDWVIDPDDPERYVTGENNRWDRGSMQLMTAEIAL